MNVGATSDSNAEHRGGLGSRVGRRRRKDHSRGRRKNGGGGGGEKAPLLGSDGMGCLLVSRGRVGNLAFIFCVFSFFLPFSAPDWKFFLRISLFHPPSPLSLRGFIPFSSLPLISPNGRQTVLS